MEDFRNDIEEVAFVLSNELNSPRFLRKSRSICSKHLTHENYLSQ